MNLTLGETYFVEQIMKNVIRKLRKNWFFNRM